MPNLPFVSTSKKQDEICILYTLTIFWKSHCQAYGWLMPLTTLCAVLAKLIVVISAYPTNVFILIDVLSNHFHTIWIDKLIFVIRPFSNNNIVDYIDYSKSLAIKIDEAFFISLAIICCSNRLILLIWIKDLWHKICCKIFRYNSHCSSKCKLSLSYHELIHFVGPLHFRFFS